MKMPKILKAFIALHLFFIAAGTLLIVLFLKRDISEPSLSDFIIRVTAIQLILFSVAIICLIVIRPKQGKVILYIEGGILILLGLRSIHLFSVLFGLFAIFTGRKKSVQEYFMSTAGWRPKRWRVVIIGALVCAAFVIIAYPMDTMRIKGLEEAEIERTGIVFAIPAEFDDATDFDDGYAHVKRGKEQFLIDTEGKVWKEIDSKADKWLGGERFTAKDPETRLTGLIDASGKELAAPRYQIIYPFSDELAIAYYERQGSDTLKDYVVLDENGEIVLDLSGKYDDVNEKFSQGLLGVTKDGKSGYINRKGEEVIPINLPYRKVYPFQNGLARVERGLKPGEKTRDVFWGEDEEHKFGFIDTNGKLVLEDRYWRAGDYSEGLISYSEKEVYYDDESLGYMNGKGEMIIPPRYGTADSFSEGLARTCKSYFCEGITLINQKGDAVLSLSRDVFRIYGDSHNHLIRVCVLRTGKQGFIQAPVDGV